MVDLGVLPGFVAVILLFLAPPGPDMTYVVAVGLQGGRVAALRAILGIGTGMSVYAAAVVVGVGRLAQTQPLLLDGVKVLGAAYLLRLAWTTARDARRTRDGAGSPPTGRPYLRGVVVSLANPKVMLFFVSVLPQFLGDAEAPGVQLAMLGAVNVLTEVLLYGAIGVLAGGLHARFSGRRGAGVTLSRVAAAVYAALAVVLGAEALAGAVGG